MEGISTKNYIGEHAELLFRYPNRHKLCILCGNPYFVSLKKSIKNSKYCGRDCSNKVSGRRSNPESIWSTYHNNKCNKCGKKVSRGKEFCSSHRPYSDETRKKIGDSNRGKRRSDEFRKKISGPNSHLWKGGISPIHKRIRRTPEYKEWRKAVFKRDNWTCQNCKKRGCELHSHHIKSFANFPELRFDIKNGMTLCVPCHEKTDNYKGKSKKK